MNTDRELLKLAAKAVGYVVVDWAGAVPMVIKPNKSIAVEWNPRTDDGDAQRLAVKMRMMITPSDDGHEVRVDLYTGHHWTEFCGDDPGAATRLAITHITAEIGKTMP